jgi:flagellar export protein FliJ
MTRSERLHRVSSLIGIDEKARARRVEALAGDMATQREQIEMLRRYREEIAHQQSNGRVGQTFTVRDLQDQQVYLAALDRAIHQGEQRQQLLDAELSRLREAWASVKRRVDAIDRVADGARREEQRHSERKAQDALDDQPKDRGGR